MASNILNSWAVGRCLARRASAVRKPVKVQTDSNFISTLHSRILSKLGEDSLPTDCPKNDSVQPIAAYYFDGQGKSIRPQIVLTLAKAVCGEEKVSEEVMKIAMIAEMIHTGSLIHDDVIDKSDKRRGKDSANAKWGVKNAVMAGNYVIAHSSQLLASLKNDEATKIISRIIDDLIHGELCQLESVCSTHHARYEQYINKTYLKTASLIANSCEAIAHIKDATPQVQAAASRFGKFLGLAFQIQDDRLDFVSNSSQLGKPACADLKLGLSTAPVLFACQEFEKEMFPLMQRRFSINGDVEKAYDIITERSEALLRTRLLAENFAKRAELQISEITSDPVHQERLIALTKLVTNRDK